MTTDKDALLREAEDAIGVLCDQFRGGTASEYFQELRARITAALAGRDEKINADLLRLARELDGVVEDNHLGVFDRVCAETVSRVRNELIALAAAKEPK